MPLSSKLLLWRASVIVMRRPLTVIVPPLFIGSRFFTPLVPSHDVISQMPTTVAPVALADRGRVGDVIASGRARSG